MASASAVGVSVSTDAPGVGLGGPDCHRAPWDAQPVTVAIAKMAAHAPTRRRRAPAHRCVPITPSPAVTSDRAIDRAMPPALAAAGDYARPRCTGWAATEMTP